MFDKQLNFKLLFLSFILESLGVSTFTTFESKKVSEWGFNSIEAQFMLFSNVSTNKKLPGLTNDHLIPSHMVDHTKHKHCLRLICQVHQSCIQTCNFLIAKKEEMADHTCVFSVFYGTVLKRKSGKSADQLKSCQPEYNSCKCNLLDQPLGWPQS